MSKRLALCNSLPDGLTAGGMVFEVALASATDGSEVLPDWIQLTLRGPIVARDGRPFVFEPERLVEAFRAGGLKLPIDFNHESEFIETLGARPARAWIVDLQARAEGLFGKVEWGADAVAALKAKSYRYISPSIFLEADQVTARLLKGAALVSAPALNMPAIAAASPHQETSMSKAILAALGLVETAPEADAISAVARLKAGDPALFVPKSQHEATLTALAAAEKKLKDADDAAHAARCSTLVDDAVKGGKIAPAAKAQYLALATSNYDGTKAAIDAMPVVLKAGADLDKDKLDPSQTQGQLSDAEKDVARRMGLSNEAYLAARPA